MAISTYAELQASIAAWLNRKDLGTVIPDFIRLGEERIFRDLRDRSNEKTEVQVGIVPIDSAIPVPADLAEVKTFTVNGKLLERMSDQYYLELVNDRTVSTTQKFARLEDKLYLWGTTTGPIDYELRYWARLGPLSVSVPTTPTLTLYPSLYLYSALIEGANFMMMGQQDIGRWTSLYALALSDVNNQYRRSELAGNTLRPPQRASGTGFNRGYRG